MTATIRVVLDQLVAPTDADLAVASLETARALVRTAPKDCAVEAVVPAGEERVVTIVPGVTRVRQSALPRRELVAAWQLGVAPSLGGGMLHAPTLAAPLVRHDRVNTGDQTVVTLWDLAPWEHPGELARTAVAWHRGMLRRAARYADAVVVPSFAMAARLEEIVKLGERIRVVAGAAPDGYRAPNDAHARVRDLALPDRFVVVCGTLAPSSGLATALDAVSASVDDDRHLVVIGPAEGDEPAVADLAAAAGIPERHVHVRPGLDAADRAALLDAAELLVDAGGSTAWPWRRVEALALGVPVVALDTDLNREVLADGGVLAPADELAAAVAGALAADRRDRLRVLSADRGRAFSWDGAAEQIWALHAML